MNKEFLIRDANVSDVKSIRALEVECFSSLAWSETLIKQEISDVEKIVIVAEEKNIILGYAAMSPIIDEGHIMNIAVGEQYRGQGIGRKLMQVLLTRAKMLSLIAITLEVNRENPSAINLYSSLGFTLEGVRPKYYKGKDDALIYWLRF